MYKTVVKREHFHQIFRLYCIKYARIQVIENPYSRIFYAVLNCTNNVIIPNMWLHITKSLLQNWYLNQLVMSIDKRLIIETFENESVRSHAKYQITFSKTTEKASLIYQRLKKRKNQLAKKAKKLIET